MKKSITGFLGLALAAAAMASSYVPAAYATSKTNCNAVMQELSTGKKPKQVALDLSISTSSVYRCRHLAKKHMAKAAAGMAHEPEPAASAAPEMAPPPAAH